MRLKVNPPKNLMAAFSNTSSSNAAEILLKLKQSNFDKSFFTFFTTVSKTFLCFSCFFSCSLLFLTALAIFIAPAAFAVPVVIKTFGKLVLAAWATETDRQAAAIVAHA